MGCLYRRGDSLRAALLATTMFVALLAIPCVHAAPSNEEMLRSMAQTLKDMQGKIDQLNSKIKNLEAKQRKTSEKVNAQPIPVTQQTAPIKRTIIQKVVYTPANISNAQKLVNIMKNPVARREIKRLVQEEQGKRDSSIPKGYWRIGNTDGIITVGGYVRVEGRYDAANNTGDASNLPGLKLPIDIISPLGANIFDAVPTTDASRKKNAFRAHARSSRFWIRSVYPSRWGDIVGYVEVDFFGTTNFGSFVSRASSTTLNSWNARARHLYVAWNGFLVGQTWSNFADMMALGETVEFNGPTGGCLVRQPQIRYSINILDNLSLNIALENPQTDYLDAQVVPYDNGSVLGGTQPVSNTTTFSGYGTASVPDLTARAVLKFAKGHISIRGVLRRLKVKVDRILETDLGEFNKFRKSKYGWGVGVSGKFYTNGKSYIFGQFNGGKGIGRYIFDAAGYSAYFNFNTENSTANRDGIHGPPTLEPLTVYGFMLGYSHYFSEKLRANISYGQTSIKNKDKITHVDDAIQQIIAGANTLAASLTSYGRANKVLRSFHANAIYSPIPALDIGVEYALFIRKVYASNAWGGQGKGKRFSLMFKYKFNHK